ncbi:Double RNA binding domain protein 6A [Trypanosoma cruzi]|nr:Double RNA binding domain protein 6A [Trypanosoma cruzi]
MHTSEQEKPGDIVEHPSDEMYSHANLFIRHLPRVVDENELRMFFSPYGQILSAAVMRNIHTGENLGTAFVRYATNEQARTALHGCNGRFLHGRAISVHWAKKRHDNTPIGDARKKIFKLFVRNIPLDVSADELARLFACFGPVGSVSLHKDTAVPRNKWMERRIGFVAFLAEGAAEKAAEAVHNTRPFPGSGSIPLMVKLAEDVPARNRRPGAAVTDSIRRGGAPNDMVRTNATDRTMTRALVDEGRVNCCRSDFSTWSFLRWSRCNSPQPTQSANASSANYLGNSMPQPFYGCSAVPTPSPMRDYMFFHEANRQRVCAPGMPPQDHADAFLQQAPYLQQPNFFNHAEKDAATFHSLGAPQKTLGSSCSSLCPAESEEASTPIANQYFNEWSARPATHNGSAASRQGAPITSSTSFCSAYGTNIAEESSVSNSTPTATGGGKRCTRYTHNPYRLHQQRLSECPTPPVPV